MIAAAKIIVEKNYPPPSPQKSNARPLTKIESITR